MQTTSSSQFAWPLMFIYRKLLLCGLVLVAAGCKESGDPRVDLSGNITWQGRPIPAGHLLFSPDPTSGNKGPQGMSAIVDGTYDTRTKGGRPAVPGPLTVTVHAFDGVDVTDERPNGRRMFMPYELNIEAPAKSGKLDIQIPDDAQKVPAT